MILASCVLHYAHNTIWRVFEHVHITYAPCMFSHAMSRPWVTQPLNKVFRGDRFQKNIEKDAPRTGVGSQNNSNWAFDALPRNLAQKKLHADSPGQPKTNRSRTGQIWLWMEKMGPRKYVPARICPVRRWAHQRSRMVLPCKRDVDFIEKRLSRLDYSAIECRGSAKRHQKGNGRNEHRMHARSPFLLVIELSPSPNAYF